MTTTAERPAQLAKLPIPPLELRRLVGPTDPEDFDNPSGTPIYADYRVPDSAYRSVFDFGCGCGRVARQLLLQTPQPKQYIGVDPNRSMIHWAQANLTPGAPTFRFIHHDVYSPSYAPGNSLRLSQPFPAADQSCSLLIAHSVFTHLARAQIEYYLNEVARVLTHDGVACTTWLLFDRASFPFLPEGPFCLYVSEADFARAVICDRRWLLATVRRVGLRIRETVPPRVPGHQWMLLLERRRAEQTDDAFPTNATGAEFLCGATYRPMSSTPVDERVLSKTKGGAAVAWTDADTGEAQIVPPALFGPLLDIKSIRGLTSYRVGRALTWPARALRDLVKT